MTKTPTDHLDQFVEGVTEDGTQWTVARYGPLLMTEESGHLDETLFATEAQAKSEFAEFVTSYVNAGRYQSMEAAHAEALTRCLHCGAPGHTAEDVDRFQAARTSGQARRPGRRS